MAGERGAAAAALAALLAGALATTAAGCEDGADAARACTPAGPHGAADVAAALGVAALLPAGDTPDDAARRAEAFALMAGGGLSVVRRDFLWREIEPTPGSYEFDAYDALVDDALVHGVTILGLLVYGNPWASPGAPDDLRPPDDLDAFADYAGATAAHFAGRVGAWEVWNEPNVAFFWTSGPAGEPDVYADLLVRSSAAIRDANPDALVVFAGTLWHAQPFVVLGAPDFLEGAFAAVPDLADTFDVYAVHPYALYPPQFPPEAAGVGEVPIDAQIAAVRAVLDAHGGSRRPVWVTELGWPTWGAVSDALQARWLVRAALLALAAGAAQIDVYTLYDSEPGTGRVPPEEDFGLYAFDPQPLDGVPPSAKAAVPALALLRTVLAGTHAVCAAVPLVGADEPGAPVHALRFESDGAGRRVTAVWQEEASGAGETRAAALAPLPGAADARLVLGDGTERLLDPAAPSYILFPTPDVVYVVESMVAP